MPLRGGDATSLRARMTTGFTLAFALLVALVGAGFLTYLRHDLQVNAVAAARDAAEKLVEEWEEDRNLSAAFGELREESRLADVAVRVIDDHGRTVGTNRRFAPAFSPNRDAGWLTASTRYGAYTILAGVNTNPIDQDLQRASLILLFLALPVVGTAALLAWTLVGRTLQPIADLAAQAAASNDALHVRLADPSADAEVRRLVETLNGLLDRLRRGAEAREQFYAAAAHELRTPLAVLAGTIELALNRPRTVEEHVETLSELQRETRRLIALSEGLLTLNRLQTPSAAREPAEPVDLAEQAANSLATLAPIVRARRLQIATEWPDEPIETHSPPAHVAMIVRNLIENAVKYTPEGQDIGIVIARDSTTIDVRVSNDYPDAAKLPLGRLFEPFYRADLSRSPAAGGDGLGLAICRQIADAHGWRLTLAAVGSDTLTATATFPAH